VDGAKVPLSVENRRNRKVECRKSARDVRESDRSAIMHRKNATGKHRLREKEQHDGA